MHPRSMDTIFLPLLAERRCSSCATTSLPEPFSPVISTLASVIATRPMLSFSWRIFSDSPMNSLAWALGCSLGSSTMGNASFLRFLSRSSCILSRFRAMAEYTTSSTFLLSQGLGMKSTAPALMARTAFSVFT